jgi:hypothetical protein
MLFYVDEIAPYIPPYPRNPPPKEAYAFLFKQARKYGVGLIAATQNITDIDYKALAQVNTWCLGRMMTRQDIARVKQIIQSIDPTHSETVLKKLPSLRTGEFLILSPDVFDDVVNFQVRWLLTNHLTLDEKDINQSITSETKQFFKKYQQKQKTTKGKEEVLLSYVDSDLPNRVKLFLNSVRQSVTAEYVANNLNVDLDNVQNALNSLVKSKIVKESKTKNGEEILYWLSKFGFKPSKNVLGEVMVIPTRITQVEALKKAKPWLEGGLFAKQEVFYDANFSHIPIWKVLATRKAKHLFFFRKEEIETYYLSATTGAMISIERGTILFHRLMTKNPGKLKDLDDDENITFIPRLPREVQKIPKIKIGRQKIYSKLKLTLGVSPISSELVLLPIWSLKVKHKKKKKKRTIIMDSATGRRLAGCFKSKRKSNAKRIN